MMRQAVSTRGEAAPWAFVPVAVGWIAGVLAYFAPAWAGGRVLAFGDALNQDLPLRLLAFGALARGELPFWNPWTFAGQPLLAAIQVGVLFPGNWGFAVLSPAAAMNLAAIGAVATAGLGMLAFGRALGLGRAAALVGAIAFAGSGFMATHLENLQIAQVASLAPALLWAVARLAETGRKRYAAAGALILAAQVCAGHPQTLVFGGLAVAAYVALRAARGPADGARRFLARAVGVAAAGGGLAALQLLPTLAFIPATSRALIPWDQLVARSLPPRQALTLWLPQLFGGWPTAAFPTPYWGVPAATDLAGYVGVAALALSVLALGRGPRRAEALGWGAIAAGGLLLALGSFTPLYRVVAALPLLGALPAPGRWLLVVDLALSTLAMLGAQRLLAGAATSRLTLAWLVGAGPALAGALGLLVFGPAIASHLTPWLPPGSNLLAGWQPSSPGLWLPALLALATAAAFAAPRLLPRAAAPLLVALVAADLAAFGWHAGWRQRALLATDLPFPPALALSAHGRALAVYPDPVYPYDQPAVMAALRLPNWGALSQVRHVGGYDAFVYARYAELLGDLHSGGAMARPAEAFRPGARILDLLGTREVLLAASLAADPAWRARLAPPRFSEIAREPGVVRFANHDALPRAWRVSRLVQADRAATRLALAGATPFDPRAEALVASAPVPLTPGSARLITETMNGLELESTGDGPGFVVVSTGFDPGWVARDDAGDPLAVERADGCLLGVHVPAGVVRLHLRYVPPGLLPGLALGLLTLLAGLAWLRPRRPA